MLRQTVITAALAVACLNFAQAQTPFFTAGFKVGVNLSQLKGNDLSIAGGTPFNLSNNDNRALGFTAGGFFRLGKKLFIQPEIMLSQKGGKYVINGTGGTVSAKEIDVKFSNLDFPVLVGARLANVFRINVGPVFSLNLSDNGNLKDSFKQY